MKNTDDLSREILYSITFIKKYIWVIIPILILLGYLFFRFAFYVSDYSQKGNYNYQKLSADSLNFRVTSNYESRGSSFVTFEGDKKIWLPYSENRSYQPHLLCRFICPGDIIIKARNNDTLIILRKDSKYIFILGERIK